MKKWLLVLLVGISFTTAYGQRSWDGGAGTNKWGDANNWDNNAVPLLGETVTIGSGYSIVVDVNAQCASLTFSANAVNTLLSINSGISLTVTGAVTYNIPSSPASQTLAVGDGSLSCGSIVMTNTPGATYTNNLTVNNGTFTVSGNITTPGAANENLITLSGSGAINIGGTFAGPNFNISGTGSTVKWYGNNASFMLPTSGNYYNLIIQIPATATQSWTRAIPAATTINGNLTVESLHASFISTLNSAALDLTVALTTTVNARGEILDNTNAGTNTFTGKLTINSGGLLTSTAGNSSFVFTGGIDNYGTFNKSAANAVTLNGAQTINNASASAMTLNGAITNSQPLIITNSIAAINFGGAFTTSANVTHSGAAAQTFSSTYSIQGATTVTNQNTNIVTVTGNLDGNNAGSTWVNDVNSTLNYTGAAAPMVTAGVFTTTASPNTVNYNGGAQSIKAGDYNNLTFSGTVGKTLQGLTNVNNACSVSGTAAIICGTNNLNLLGSVSYTGSGLLSSGANAVVYNSTSTQDILPGIYSGTLTIQGTGDKSLKGATTVTGTYTHNANLSCGNNNLTLNGTVTYTSGTLTSGTNLITYGSTSAQSIISASYNGLTLSGNTSAKSLLGNIVVGGAFIYNCNPGTFSCGSYNATFSGAVTHTSGTFSTGVNVVTYNGAGAQNLLIGTYSGDLVLSGGAKTLSGATVVAGNFQMASDLLCGGQNLTLSGAVTYTSGTFSSTGGTVSYSGAGAQNLITGSIGGALTISGGDKTLVAGVTPLTVTGTSTLNANLSTGANNVIFNGNVTMNGNITAGTGNMTFNLQQTYTSGTFSTGANTVTYGGGAAQNLFGGTYGGNLTISGAGAKTLVAASTSVAGTFSMASALACGTFNLTLNGLVTYTSGALTTGANTVTYGRTGDQNVINATYSGSLAFAGSGNRTLLASTIVTNAITVPTGIVLGINGFTLSLSNNLTVDPGGQVDVVSTGAASSTLAIANTRTVTNNGTFRVIGNATYPAIVTQYLGGTYSITQPGATAVFAAGYYQFNYLNNGIVISNGSIDATNNFSNGSFSNGIGAQSINLTGLTFSNFQADNVVFNSGPTYNVTRTSGSGAVTFANASGTLYGEQYDNDNGNPGTLINWTNSLLTFYSGAATIQAASVTDWWSNTNGTGSHPSSITDGTAVLIVQNGHTATLDGTINVLDMRVNNGGTLVMGGSATQSFLKVQQTLTVVNGGNISAGSQGSSPHAIWIYGNVANDGTINLVSGSNTCNLEFYGTNGTPSQIGGTGTTSVNDLNFKTPAIAQTVAQANSAILVKSNVNIENNATFNDGGQTLTVLGNWNETGTGARTGLGTVIFNGILNQISNSAAQPVVFNNITFSGGFAAQIDENITVNGNMIVNNDTRITNVTNSIAVAGDFTVSGANSQFKQTASTVTFNGALQNITVNANTEFFTIVFSGTNTKNVTGNIVAKGNMTINAGVTVTGTGNHTITNSLTVDGTCNFSGSLTFTAAGNITSTLLNTTINLNQLTAITVNNTTTVTTAGTLTVHTAGSLTVNGTLIISANSLLTGGTSFSMPLAASVLTLQGLDNFPTGFATYTLLNTSTVNYTAATNQTVRGNISYGNLVITGNATTKTLDNNMTVLGNINFANNANTPTLALNGHDINLEGSTQNFNAATINGSGGGTFNLSAADASQTLGAASLTLTNLTFSLSAPTAIRTRTITATTFSLTGNFTATNNGSFNHIINVGATVLGGTPQTLSLGANCELQVTHAAPGTDFFSKFASMSLNINSTINYFGGTQTIASGFSYANVLLTGAGFIKTAAGALDINGNIGASGASLFNDAGLTHTVAGNWNLGVANAIPGNMTGTIVLDGSNQTIAASYFNNLTIQNSGTASLGGAITLGTAAVAGNFTVQPGAKFDALGYAITISGNWANAGSFKQNTAAITTFNGNADQTITNTSGSYFGGLTINKPLNSSAISNSDISVNGVLTLTANSGILNIGNYTANISGNFICNDNTVQNFITTGTVNFNGLASQTIIPYRSTLPYLTFQNVSFSGSDKSIYRGAAGALTYINITGNVNISSMVVANWGGNNAINFYVGGNWFDNGSFTNTQTVEFNGADQSIGTETGFNNVIFSGTGTKTLGGNVTMNGSLTINDNVTLNANNNDITLNGDWNNNLGTNNGKFIPATGTVTFKGAANANINSGGTGAGKQFNNFTVNRTGGTLYIVGGLYVMNDVNFISGTFNSNNISWSLGGSLIYSGGTYTPGTATITFNGIAGNYVIDPGLTNPQLGGIFVNADPAAIYTVQNNFQLNKSSTFSGGKFDLNGKYLSVTGNGTRLTMDNANAIFEIDAGATVDFTGGTTPGFTVSNGVFRLVGSPALTAKITGNGANWNMNMSGGSLHALNYVIDQTQGLNISGTTTIDATENLTNGIFKNGRLAAGSYFINLNGSALGDFSVSNVSFIGGAVANNPQYNVQHTSGTGTVTFVDTNGSLAGEAYDNDNGVPGTLINWTYPNGFFWDRGAGTDNWLDADNWTSNSIPDNTKNIFLNHQYVAGAYSVNINSGNADAKDVTIDPQGAGAISLNLSNGYALNMKGSLTNQPLGTLTLQNNTSTINIGGNWVNAGTFTPNGAKVTFNGVPGTYVITGYTGAGKPFYDMEINSPGSVYQLSQPMDVDHNLTVTAGTLDLLIATNDITVGGDWLINGATGGNFTHSNADVTFDGTNQNISGGTFFNFITAGGSGTKTAATNITVTSALTIGIGTTLNAGTNTLYVAGNWINNGTFSETGVGTVEFNGAGAQSIDNGTATTSFNHLLFSNGGGNRKTFMKASLVNGDVTINSGATMDVSTYTLNGAGASNTFTNNGTLRISGASNFPTGFETMSFTPSSTTSYIADINQTIYPGVNYGNLTLARLAAGTPTKTAGGNLTVTGNLDISDGNSILDFNTNNANITLTGNLNFQPGNSIVWGSGSTLTHVGVNTGTNSSWAIDPDIPGFNNLVLAGSGGKYMNGNLNITGNVTVKTGVSLLMYATYNSALPHTMTSTVAGKTFTMETGASVYSPVPASGAISGPAFPTAFTTYTLAPLSNTYLNSAAGIDQTLYTANGISYGNLTFNNAKTVTSDGVAVLDINGSFNTNTATFIDNGKNITIAGADIFLCNYTPSASTISLTLDGNGVQYIRENNGNNILDFGNLILSGTGTKTLGDGNDVINIAGNFTNSANITTTTNRNILFSGQTWTNNGYFQQTTSTTTFDRASAPTDQTINPGVYGALNYFNNLVFSNTNVKTISTNGLNVTGTFTASNGTLNMGSLTHYISGNVNTIGSTFNSNTASFVFNGAGQTIRTAAFTAGDVTLSGSGTKQMFQTWDVNNLTINTSTTLQTSDGLGNFWNINVRGNWLNSGTYTTNTNTVTFNSTLPACSIVSGGSNFYDVVIGNSNTAGYTLGSPSTRILRALTVGSNATLNLNSNTLILGSTIGAGKTYTINGTLNVNENAILALNNVGSQAVMTVNGRLNLVGKNRSSVATITADNVGGSATRSRISIESGATIAAKNYFIEYLEAAGLNVKSGSTLDATNNFSNGTWSNLNAAVGSRYVILNASNYTGGVIDSVCFNYPTAPVATQQYNVQRTLSTPVLTFGNSTTGNLGSYLFENDDMAVSATQGSLRWPANTLTFWTGAVNTDWNNAGNWSSGVPNASVSASIPYKPNIPNIMNADAACKDLTITDGSLILQGGYSLVTTGDVTITGTATHPSIVVVASNTSKITVGGNWTVAANGSFIHGNSSVLFNSSAGSIVINPGTSDFNNLIFDNPNTTFTLNGATVNIKGKLEILNGTVTAGTNAYVYNIYGDFNNLGTFNPLNGTINFIGTQDQLITSGNFFNTTFGGTGIKTTQGNIAIGGTTIVSSTLKAETGSVITFNNNVTIQAPGTFDDGGNSHFFSGTTWTGTGNYLGSGTVIFNNSANNTNITINASKFFNLELDITGTGKTILGNGALEVRNNLTLNTGNMDIAANTVINPNNSGTFFVGAANTFSLSGSANFPSGFASYSLDPTSTVNYKGTDQTVQGSISYGQLTLNNANTKTLNGDIAILGALNFNTSTLDVSPNNYNITVSGNWNNNTTGKFVARSGAVTFDNSLATQNITLNSNNNFYDLLIDKTAGTSAVLQGSATATVLNDLTSVNGIFNINNRQVTVGGSLQATAGTFTGNGEFVLTKASGNANLSTNGSILNNVTVSAGATATYTVQDNLSLIGNFILNSGIFDGNGKTISLGNGNTDVVTINGTYKVGPGGKLGLGYSTGLTVNNTGTIEVVGNSASLAAVSNNASGGRYNFIVNGTIKAKYYQFDYMGGNAGIDIAPGAIIDPANNFSYGTFTNGQTNASMLTIETSQTFTALHNNYITDVSFPINPGSGAKNVTRVVTNTDTVEFYNSSGVFAGAAFENDPFNRIKWTAPIVLTWNGTISKDWFTIGNWTASSGSAIVPTGNEDVIIPSGTPNMPEITASTGAFAKNLTINNGATLTLNTPADAGATDLTILSDFKINGRFIMSTAGDYVNVAGNWTKGGTGLFTTNGTVTFIGVGSSKMINNGTASFYNLSITGTTLYQLVPTVVNYTIVRNDLTLAAGTQLDLLNSDLFIGGNYSSVNGLVTRARKVTFNATSGVHTINSGTTPFYDVDVDALGTTYNISGTAMNIGHNLNILNGTLNLNGQYLNMGDGVNTPDNLTISGILNVGAGSTLRMGNGATLSVATGGLLALLGTNASSISSVTNQGAGTYSFDVLSGGTLQASYYFISNLNANGLNMNFGAILDRNYNLSNGTFTNGASSGSYLTFANDFGGDDTIKNVVFNAGPTYNVTRLTGTDIVYFSDASGALGTFNFENDVNGVVDASSGLIQWPFVNTYQWTGAVNHDWHTAGNWNPANVPNLTKYVVIPKMTNDPIVTSDTAKARKISISPTAILTINSNQPVIVAEEMYNQGILTVNGTSVITVGDNWTSANGGIFNAGSSKVVLTSPATNKTITPGASSFNDLEIKTGQSSVSYLLNANTVLTGSLTLTKGKLDVNGFNITVGKNWSNNAEFVSGLKTVTFNGTSGTNTITQNGIGSFYNLTFAASNSATYKAGSNINVTNSYAHSGGVFDLSPDNGTTSYNLIVAKSVSISGGTLIGRAGNIQVGLDWVLSGTGLFTCGTSTVTAVAASGSRNINPLTSSFYNLTINGNASFRLSNNTILNNNLTISAGTLDVSTGPSYNLSVKGNWTNNGTFMANAATVTFNGSSGTSTINAGNSSFNNLIINGSGATYQLSHNAGVTNNFTLSNGTLDNSSYILTLTGNWVNNGTFTPSTGTVIFNGIAQSITGTTAVNTFYNMTVAGSLLTLPATANVTVSNTLTTSGGGSLYLMSNASRTASLIQNSAGVTATIERYMSSNHWHNMASAVAGQSVSGFITNVANTIPTSGIKYGMEYYSEPGNGWTFYTTASTPGNLVPGTGYLVRHTTDAAVISAGTMDGATANIAVPRTNFGWNSLGNPFPCSIGVRSDATTTENFLTKNAAQLDPNYAALYVWDEPATIVAGVSYYKIICNAGFINNTGRTVLDQAYMQPGQGFVVKAKSGGGTVSFTQAMRLHENTGTYFKSAPVPWPGINLKVSSTTKTTSTAITLNEKMTRGLDPTYDAGLLGGDPAFKLYSRLVEDNGVNFALQCLPLDGFEKMTVPLGFDCTTAGTVTFSADVFTLPDNVKAVLVDSLLGISTDLSVPQASYTVTLTAASSGIGRFYLNLSAPPVESSKTTTVSPASPAFPTSPTGVNEDQADHHLDIYTIGNEIVIKGAVTEKNSANLYDLTGNLIRIYKLQPGNLNILPTQRLPFGVYLVKVYGDGVIRSQKIVLE